MGKEQSSKKGKPRSAGSRQSKIAYYHAHAYAPNIARKAFRSFRLRLNLRIRDVKKQGLVANNTVRKTLAEIVNNKTLDSIRSRKVRSNTMNYNELIVTHYLKKYNNFVQNSL